MALMKKSGKIAEYFKMVKQETGIFLLPDLCEKSDIYDEDWASVEQSRLLQLYSFENSFTDKDKRLKFIAGVDEVGRGPVAGPVVAAAVVFDKPVFLPGLDDSKKVSEKHREILYDIITNKAVSYSIGIADVQEIDKLNILHASLLAMSRAVNGLKMIPQIVLADGNQLIPYIDCQQESVVKGDSKVYSIASASIIAKVTRDRIMKEYDLRYAGYNFSQNKGYCTRDHIEALKKLGPCPVHRKSFGPVKALMPKYKQMEFI
jgi:ribonuclease HII